MNWLIERYETAWRTISAELSSTEFYVQVGIVALAVVVGWMLGAYILYRVRLFREEPKPGALEDLRWTLPSRGRPGTAGIGGCRARDCNTDK